MLTHLSIRNVVLIEALAIDFARGLSALTGETGAGKSILLDALGLALGGRSDVALMKAGTEQASVSAVFALADGHPALAILNEQGLAEQGLDSGERELVLRRQVSRDGRSRAFVNDQPVSVGLLRQLGDCLLEVQGQFEQRGLLDPATHRQLLDAFAGLEEDAGRLAERWRAWRRLEEETAQAAAALEAARREEEFLRHALTELTAFAPESGELERLSEARSLWRHREKLIEAVTGALGHIAGGAGNGGAERALAATQRLLERAAPQAGQRLTPALAALERAAAELAEASQSLSALASGLEGDSGNGEAIEERYFALLELARKHKVEPDALPALIERLAEQLAALDRGGESLAQLKAARDKAAQDYRSAAEALSAARAKAAGAQLVSMGAPDSAAIAALFRETRGASP
ncbi:MAG: AAA family ATPase [Kiloniellales bacterium]